MNSAYTHRMSAKDVMQLPLESHVTFSKCINQICTHMHLQSHLNLKHCIYGNCLK